MGARAKVVLLHSPRGTQVPANRFRDLIRFLSGDFVTNHGRLGRPLLQSLRYRIVWEYFREVLGNKSCSSM